jgi:hypothetical protein
MGFEVEIHRRITDASSTRLNGDTKLLRHPWFTLVSDKLTRNHVKFSNMEFVVAHFDQYTVPQLAAVPALTDRIAAIQAMRDQLYAADGPLGNVVTTQQGAHQIQFYNDPTYGQTQNLLVAQCPGDDDNRLYVHYTVGFPPSEWEAMLAGILTRSRADGADSRARTHLTNGIAVAATTVTALNAAIGTAVNQHGGQLADVQRELRGHLALLYMHAAVFIDRTLDLKLKELQNSHAAQAEINNVTAQLPFGRKQPKNKIAALPRTSLANMWGLLSQAARAVLAANVDPVLNAFADKFENAHGLDFPDNYKLVSPIGTTASLVEFITAGLDGQAQYSQQVLFGGMNEVGVDNSVVNRPTVPFEFRQIFGGRVDFPTFQQNATSVLHWSRDLTQAL